MLVFIAILAALILAACIESAAKPRPMRAVARHRQGPRR